MVIQATDRIARVLNRDEDLLDVFVSASPQFERLRSPSMRHVMARLVTVEQAAKIAGVSLDDLLSRLNDAVTEPSVADAPEDATASEHGKEMSRVQTPDAPISERFAPDQIVDLDVREDLRNGREPFSQITAAKQALPAGNVLRLRATFEPVPLYRVMEQQGFAHWTEELAPDDWRVWFYEEESSEAPATAESSSGSTPEGSAGEAAVEADEQMIVLDVRGLEPPEPMVRTLAALETLPRGATLLQINVRVPQFLIPRIEELGFEYEIREQSEDLVRMFIRHGEDR